MKKMLKWSLQAGKIAEGLKMVSQTTLLSSTVWIKGLLHMLHLHLELLQHFHFTKHPAFTASQHRRQRSSKDSWYIHSVRNTPLHLVTFSSGSSVLSNLKIVIFRAVGMTFWCKTSVFEKSSPPHFIKQNFNQNWLFTPKCWGCICPSCFQEFSFSVACSLMGFPSALPSRLSCRQAFHLHIPTSPLFDDLFGGSSLNSAAWSPEGLSQ